MATRRRFLFVHQNFPGQFAALARSLAADGHEVVALGIGARPLPGVRVLRYPARAPERPSALTVARDFEVKVVRALACAEAMQQLRRDGFVPDTIVAHPGWGEALFCRDVFPQARLLILAEFFYRSAGADVGFDPEFGPVDEATAFAVRLKNTALLHALHAADGGYAPTAWQHAQIPDAYRHRFEVIFEGVDTERVAPNPEARLRLQAAGPALGVGDEVITFVSRHLEPYRGFHVFMRALPEILARRPAAQVLIVGRDGRGYGHAPSDGRSWRQHLMDEVGERLPRDRVHFLGPLPYAQYLQVLKVSACHVYLSYPFVLSWSCVEALSAGALVVGSATPPVQEFIRHGHNGLLVDFFDTAALADTVCRTLADPAAGAPLRAAARAGVRDALDQQRHCLPRLRALALGDRNGARLKT